MSSIEHEWMFGRPPPAVEAAEEFGDEVDDELTSSADTGEPALESLRELQLPAAKVSIEAVLGLLAAFFIGFIAPLAAFALTMTLRLPPVLRVFAGLLTVGYTGWLAILVARLASAALEGDDHHTFSLAGSRPGRRTALPPLYIPLALAMAVRVPRFLPPMNLAVSGWWLLHFGAAAGLGHLAAMKITRDFQLGQLLLAVPCSIAVHFAFLFAANLYLVLSMAAACKSPLVWLFVWRYRFLIDLLLALVLLMWR